jgi:DNA-binding NarL/FixJ family response regulator
LHVRALAVAPAATTGPTVPGSPVRPRPGHPVTVGVHSDDPLGREAVQAYLGGRREIEIVSGDRRADAEVLLWFTPHVTDETLEAIGAVVADAARPPRLVLVTETMREQHLWRAVALGLSAVVPRTAATWDRVVGVVIAARAGRGEMPPVAVGWLLDQVRTLQADVLEPAGLTVAGLTTREVEVLRLLADGLDTVEIATTLRYSERTIKNVIHGMISRLGLRNRSHAVAYALRAGAL